MVLVSPSCMQSVSEGHLLWAVPQCCSARTSTPGCVPVAGSVVGGEGSRVGLPGLAPVGPERSEVTAGGPHGTSQLALPDLGEGLLVWALDGAGTGFSGPSTSSSAHFPLVPLTLSKSLFSTSAPAPCPTPATPRLLPFLPLAFYTASPLTSAGILPVMQSLCPDGQRDEFGFLQYANST